MSLATRAPFAALGVALALVSRSALSQTSEGRKAPGADASQSQPSADRRALSAGAAVVPGAIVHGAGHLVLGEKQTAGRLLLAEGIGLGMVLVGGGTLFATGASRYLVGPAAALTVLGAGLFATSLLADVYGTLSADGAAASRRLSTPPVVETAVGYRYVHDPQFSYQHFVAESLDLRRGPFRLSPSGWFSTGGDNARYRVDGAYRLHGSTPESAPTVATHLDVAVAGAHHRYAPVGFSISSAEARLDARYDLGGIGPTLRGAFVEGSLGYGHQWIDYQLPGLDVPSDDEMLLLTRFGFGVLLRGAAAPGSEVTLYYDHRHDDYAAGLLMTGLGSGVAGHFGLTGRWYFGRSLGVLAEAQAGSALLTGVSLLLREGGHP